MVCLVAINLTCNDIAFGNYLREVFMAATRNRELPLSQWYECILFNDSCRGNIVTFLYLNLLPCIKFVIKDKKQTYLQHLTA